jgi:hypothetical protein
MLQSLPETGTLRVDDLISDAGTSEAQAGAALRRLDVGELYYVVEAETPRE